jgi:hypothetical protein
MMNNKGMGAKDKMVSPLLRVESGVQLGAIIPQSHGP